MVAEKPSIAHAIAAALRPKDGDESGGSGGGGGGGGTLPCHRFDAPWRGANAHYRVTSVAGHVFSLDFPEALQDWDLVDPGQLFDAPVVKKRKVETAATSQIKLTDSERYKRDDASCAERLKKREADEMVPCIDPEIGEDDQGVGARFQGYDGFTISGPPVFR